MEWELIDQGEGGSFFSSGGRSYVWGSRSGALSIPTTLNLISCARRTVLSTSLWRVLSRFSSHVYCTAEAASELTKKRKRAREDASASDIRKQAKTSTQQAMPDITAKALMLALPVLS